MIEIFCSAALEVCEERDVKGLYQKARRGEVTNFSGVSDRYDMPLNPDVIVNSVSKSLELGVSKVAGYLKDAGVCSLRN